MTKLYSITADAENAADIWWTELQLSEARSIAMCSTSARADIWWTELQLSEPAIADDLRAGSIIVDAYTLARLAALPGWADGPECAKTACIVNEANRYGVRLSDGDCGSETFLWIDATNEDEAMIEAKKQARDWIESGDYVGTVEVQIEIMSQAGATLDIDRIEINAD